MENKDKNIKNKIIALSGQPVTGKGTTVKALISKFKEHGYEDNNIHVISTGKEFRNYFNAIFDFAKNYDNKDKADDFLNNPYIKSIVENKDYRNALMATMIKLNKLNLKDIYFDIEQANNMEEFKEIRDKIDTLVDTRIKKMGEEINSKEHPDEIWLVDSRLAFDNIPDAFSVRLTCDPEVAAKRLLNDTTRGKEDNKYNTLEEAKEAREKRRIGEQERYKERYNIDLEDDSNYNLIIDTSFSSIDDISDTILKCLDCEMKNKPFAKHWTSPKTLLPLQTERETGQRGMFYTFDELVKEIDKNGYYPYEEIEVIEADGIKGIIEGHHRNFCAAYLGKTLVPYRVIARDDETIDSSYITAKCRIENLRINDLYGHEPFFEHNTDERFSYNDIYPNIYKKLRERDEMTK